MPDLHFRLLRQSHILLAIVSLLNTCCPSQRDCFALISRLNIQSLRYTRLTRAIRSQPSKSKWYLCPRCDDISTSFTFHVAPLGNGTYSEARRFADDSKIETLNRALFSKRSFICAIFILFWRQHFATHLNAPVPSYSKHLIPSYFLQLQVDYLKIYGISIPLHSYYLQ